MFFTSLSSDQVVQICDSSTTSASL